MKDYAVREVKGSSRPGWLTVGDLRKLTRRLPADTIIELEQTHNNSTEFHHPTSARITTGLITKHGVTIAFTVHDDCGY